MKIDEVLKSDIQFAGSEVDRKKFFTALITFARSEVEGKKFLLVYFNFAGIEVTLSFSFSQPGHLAGRHVYTTISCNTLLEVGWKGGDIRPRWSHHFSNVHVASS